MKEENMTPEIDLKRSTREMTYHPVVVVDVAVGTTETLGVTERSVFHHK